MLFGTPKKWMNRRRAFGDPPAPHWFNRYAARAYPRFVVRVGKHPAYSHPQTMMYDRRLKYYYVLMAHTDPVAWTRALNLRYGWFGTLDKFTFAPGGVV
jgi:hypothetical protein